MNFKNINITFLNGKKISLSDYSVYINHNDENDWVLIDKKSIGSYSNVLLKFVNSNTKNEFYSFLESSNFIARTESIEIKTFSNINFYKTTKKSTTSKKELAEIKRKIYELNSKQYLGWTIEEVLELEDLNNLYFKTKMKKILSIEEVENYE
ncbi:MSC_0621 family F1-like ATPase epsilon subunit [Mycoplasmopsis edwardii]|nr:hypothetical protein [Mycoplasmopsis edwardii]